MCLSRSFFKNNTRKMTINIFHLLTKGNCSVVGGLLSGKMVSGPSQVTVVPFKICASFYSRGGGGAGVEQRSGQQYVDSRIQTRFPFCVCVCVCETLNEG